MTARVDAGPRTCESCGKPFERRKFGSRLEDLAQFAKRRFCKRSCYRDAAVAGAVASPSVVWCVGDGPAPHEPNVRTATLSNPVSGNRRPRPDTGLHGAAVAVAPVPGPRTAHTVPRPSGVRP